MSIKIKVIFNKPFHFFFRSPNHPIRWGQPAGRRVRQRPAPPQPSASTHNRTRTTRHKAVRHFASIARKPRMRVQNTRTLQRNRLHSTRGNWGLKTTRDHAKSGQLYSWIEAKRPGYFCLGNSGQVIKWWGMRQVQCTVRILDKSDFAKQDRHARSFDRPNSL